MKAQQTGPGGPSRVARVVHGLGRFLWHHGRCARAGRKWVKHGGTSRGRKRMMVSVVMSRATRVPDISLLLSTLLRQPTTYRGPLLAFTMTACAGITKHSQAQDSP